MLTLSEPALRRNVLPIPLDFEEGARKTGSKSEPFQRPISSRSRERRAGMNKKKNRRKTESESVEYRDIHRAFESGRGSLAGGARVHFEGPVAKETNRMSKPNYRVVLSFEGDRKVFVARAPELEHCTAEGETRALAMAHLEEEIDAQLANMLSHGTTPPRSIDEEEFSRDIAATVSKVLH